MIEITDAAAEILKKSMAEGKVIRMFLAAIDATGANYGMALGTPEKDDMVFESNGITVYMSPQDAELLGETIVDYVNDERGTGFVIRGPLDDIGGCSACESADTCSHDEGSCDHDHDSCGHCGH
ncbi:MAG TPA: iron-sulfur cluster biosynthesis family protein [Methanotrichaceae archaeon]|nr:iron-sulfur cluster biosynthesis family protein [Methanotrichaceae archaeon]